MMNDSETTDLRWFDGFAACRICGKRGQGILRGSQNQSYGAHCSRCASKRLKASLKEREKEEANVA